MLTFTDVSFAYNDNEPILKSISLEIGKTERVALVGCNGAGKSTFLSLICGVILPTQGEIRIENIPVAKKNLRQIRRKVGLVLQNPDEQLFMPNIYEDIAFGPRNFGFSEAVVKKRTDAALEKMNISHLAKKTPYRLSGGEKRSAAMATVLAMEPALILCDEPTAFLDPRATKNLEYTIKNLKTAVIIATHDLDMVMAICQRVLLLHDGSILEDGDPKEVLKDEELLKRAGLELPLSLRNCKECPYKQGH